MMQFLKTLTTILCTFYFILFLFFVAYIHFSVKVNLLMELRYNKEILKPIASYRESTKFVSLDEQQQSEPWTVGASFDFLSFSKQVFTTDKSIFSSKMRDYGCTADKHSKRQLMLDPVSSSKLESFISEVNFEENTVPLNSHSNSSKVAILIPMRDREEHLRMWLYNMIPFLRDQGVDFAIYVVEQVNSDVLFNKGILYNAGFTTLERLGSYDCLILHDIDLLAENLCHLYKCKSDTAIHLSPAVDTLKYKLPYAELIGGVVALETSAYRKINGFTNMFFGWGGEDDEFYGRIIKNNYKIERSDRNIGTYTIIKHEKNRNKTGMARGFRLSYNHGRLFYHCDGLNDVMYNVTAIIRNPLYTRIKVTYPGPKTIGEAVILRRKQKYTMHDKCYKNKRRK